MKHDDAENRRPQRFFGPHAEKLWWRGFVVTVGALMAVGVGVLVAFLMNSFAPMI